MQQAFYEEELPDSDSFDTLDFTESTLIGKKGRVKLSPQENRTLSRVIAENNRKPGRVIPDDKVAELAEFRATKVLKQLEQEWHEGQLRLKGDLITKQSEYEALRQSILESITHSRRNLMPALNKKLKEAGIEGIRVTHKDNGIVAGLQVQQYQPVKIVSECITGGGYTTRPVYDDHPKKRAVILLPLLSFWKRFKGR